MYVCGTHTNTHTHLKTLKTLKVAWVNRQGHFKIIIVRYIIYNLYSGISNIEYIYI